MYFKILRESQNYYYVREWKNFLSDFYIDHKIKKWKFRDWQKGKINMTKYDEIEKVNPVINTIQSRIDKYGYILCNDIDIQGISKAKIKQTIEDKELLAKYNLKRVRATKAIKKQLNINSKGYPFVIIKK